MCRSPCADRAISDDLGAPFGFEPDELPTFAWVTDRFGAPTIDAFADYTGLQISRGYRCSNSCDVPGYTFSAAFNQPEGYLSWLGDTLRPGTFLLGTYTPDGSHATGNITFSVVPTLAFRVYGTSLSGEGLVASIGPTGGLRPAKVSQIQAAVSRATFPRCPRHRRCRCCCWAWERWSPGDWPGVPAELVAALDQAAALRRPRCWMASSGTPASNSQAAEGSGTEVMTNEVGLA